MDHLVTPADLAGVLLFLAKGMAWYRRCDNGHGPGACLVRPHL